MDKATTKDVKKQAPPLPESGKEVLQLLQPFPGEREIHRTIGFRISSFNRAASYPPLSRLRPRLFSFYSLSHMTGGEGFLWMDDGRGVLPLSPGDAVLMPPGIVHCYGGWEAPFVEDYICFDGPCAERLARAGLLEPGILRLGSERRLLPFIDLALNQSDDGQIRAALEFQKFLSDIYRENKLLSYDSGDRRIADLLMELNRSPERWWTVSDMSGYCQLSQNRFRELFREHTGKNPKRYVEELKIRLAAEQLTNPRLRIADIARSLGYADVYHFSRVFKKVMGLAPDYYRRHYTPA